MVFENVFEQEVFIEIDLLISEVEISEVGCLEKMVP